MHVPQGCITPQPARMEECHVTRPAVLQPNRGDGSCRANHDPHSRASTVHPKHIHIHIHFTSLAIVGTPTNKLHILPFHRRLYKRPRLAHKHHRRYAGGVCVPLPWYCTAVDVSATLPPPPPSRVDSYRNGDTGPIRLLFSAGQGRGPDRLAAYALGPHDLCLRSCFAKISKTRRWARLVQIEHSLPPHVMS